MTCLPLACVEITKAAGKQVWNTLWSLEHESYKESLSSFISASGDLRPLVAGFPGPVCLQPPLGAGPNRSHKNGLKLKAPQCQFESLEVGVGGSLPNAPFYLLFSS